MVTIREVAAEAQVSVSGASKALNDYSDIGEETKAKVRLAAQKLGYVPNKSAKTLASKNTKEIAILVSGETDRKQLIELCQAEDLSFIIVKGANLYAAEHNMRIATYMIDSKSQEEKPLQALCDEYSLDGVLIFGMRTSDRYVKEAAMSRIPCVGVDYHIQGTHTTSVGTDDCKAFREITERVIAANHQKIVLMYGSREAEVAANRYKGFLQAVNAAGLDLDYMKVVDTDFHEKLAYDRARGIIQKYGNKHYTAFICMSDMIAMGVYRAVEDEGFKIPEDFSVTGFDALGFTGFVRPHLLSVNQQFFEKGYTAAAVLERLLRGEMNIENITIPYHITSGDSLRTLK